MRQCNEFSLIFEKSSAMQLQGYGVGISLEIARRSTIACRKQRPGTPSTSNGESHSAIVCHKKEEKRKGSNAREDTGTMRAAATVMQFRRCTSKHAVAHARKLALLRPEATLYDPPACAIAKEY